MNTKASILFRKHAMFGLMLILIYSSCSANDNLKILLIPHPDDSSKKIEYFLETPKGEGPWPTIIFLHGHQEGLRPGGRDFVDWGVLDQFVKRGFLSVAISQPGYGNSTGPADFCGISTQHAVAAVISKLKLEGIVSSNSIIIEGISRGALVAGLVAAHDSSITAVILISGLYDLPQFVSTKSTNLIRKSIVDSILTETGGTDEALRNSSVLYFAKDIKAATLIINGEKDERTDPNQARRLAEEIDE